MDISALHEIKINCKYLHKHAQTRIATLMLCNSSKLEN